ncbi:MAG: hypothetical protein ACRDD4_12100 [Culicoidibacterales bacterium]
MTVAEVKTKIMNLARFHRETDADPELIHREDETRTLARLQADEVWFHIVELETLTGVDFDRRDALHLYRTTYTGD